MTTISRIIRVPQGKSTSVSLSRALIASRLVVILFVRVCLQQLIVSRTKILVGFVFFRINIFTVLKDNLLINETNASVIAKATRMNGKKMIISPGQ